MKTYLKYLILLIAHIQIIYSQKWIENDVTNYLKSKYVSDVCFQKDVTWILSNNGLYKSKNGKFENYKIDTLVSGPIENLKFGKREQINYQFSSIIGNDSILWILATHGKVILKIQNDTITRYNPEFLKDHNSGFYEYCIDEKGYLWFSYSERDTAQKDEFFGFKDKYKLAYYDGTGFSIYPVPEHLSRKLFYSFIVNNSTFYFICPHYENERGMNNSFFYVLKNSFLDSISLGTALGMRPQIYYNNDTAFVFNSNDKIFIIYNNKIVDKIELTGIGLSFRSDLTHLNNNIYVTSGNGLYIYNSISKKHKITKPYDFEDNCLSDFDAIRYNKITNQLWCLYGGAYITDRYDYCHYGLSIYQLK